MKFSSMSLIWFLCLQYGLVCFKRIFVQAALSIDIDDDFRECENELPFPALDFSNFQIIPEEDGSMTLNGSVRFTGNYESPTSLLVHSKRLERGEWVPGVFNRLVQNVCPLLQMPTELWYPYTRLLKQKTCPFKAGHVEHGKPSNIGNFANLLQLPPSFIGDWRMYYEITTTRNGKLVPECLMMVMTVSEV